MGREEREVEGRYKRLQTPLLGTSELFKGTMVTFKEAVVGCRVTLPRMRVLVGVAGTEAMGRVRLRLVELSPILLVALS